MIRTTFQVFTAVLSVWAAFALLAPQVLAELEATTDADGVDLIDHAEG